jgi:hypothetical protein
LSQERNKDANKERREEEKEQKIKRIRKGE